MKAVFITTILEFYKNKAEVFEQKYHKLKTILELKQNTKTNANELADQTAFDIYSNPNQYKHYMHSSHCPDSTAKTIDDLNNSVIILNDATSFELNDSNIKEVQNSCKDLNADDALSTDRRNYDRSYSIQTNNYLHQSSPNNRQPIPTRITQRTQSKKNVRAPFWKNINRNENRKNKVATLRIKCQTGEDF